VAIWNLEDGVTVTPTFELALDGIFEGGLEGTVRANNPSWVSEGRETV
jgi:hypothetical protein